VGRLAPPHAAFKSSRDGGQVTQNDGGLAEGAAPIAKSDLLLHELRDLHLAGSGEDQAGNAGFRLSAAEILLKLSTCALL
jgi:hypothetical protein